MQRAAELAPAALGVQLGGLAQCVRIELDDRAQARAGAVEAGDAVQVGAGQGDAVQLAAGHARLQIGDVGFGVGEGNRRAGGRCRGRRLTGVQGRRARAAAGQCDEHQ